MGDDSAIFNQVQALADPVATDAGQRMRADVSNGPVMQGLPSSYRAALPVTSDPKKMAQAAETLRGLYARNMTVATGGVPVDIQQAGQLSGYQKIALGVQMATPATRGFTSQRGG